MGKLSGAGIVPAEQEGKGEWGGWVGICADSQVG